MDGIHTHIYHSKKKTKKLGKYTSPMDGMGISKFRNFSEALSSFKYADPHHFRGRIIVGQWIKGLDGGPLNKKKTRFLAPEKNSEATFFFLLGGGGGLWGAQQKSTKGNLVVLGRGAGYF